MSTARAPPTLDASNTAPCVSKNDCSTDTYKAIRVRVIIHSPPTDGAVMSSAAELKIETPPFPPQYHEWVKERTLLGADCGAACTAATAGRRATQASPAANVRIVRIAEPLMTRVNVSAVRRDVPEITKARERRFRALIRSCQRRELR